MDDEASHKVLFEMFPDLPDHTLSSIWQNCAGDLSAAVDEALTISSLDNLNEEGQVVSERSPREVQQELLDDPPWLQPPLALNHDEGTLRSSSTVEEEAEDSRRNATNVYVICTDGTPIETGSQPLPWETKTRYVIGAGELGLLNELQMPRRGAIVALASSFLRLPPVTDAMAAADASPETTPPPAVEPLIDLYHDEDGPGSVPVQLSPMVPSTSGPARKGKGVNSNPDEVVSARGLDGERVSADTGPLAPLGELASTHSTSSQGPDGLGVDSAGTKPRVSDRDNGRMGDTADKTPEIPSTVGKGVTKPRVEEFTSADDSPPNITGLNSRWVGGRLSASRRWDVETASAADRIAAFRPGTRFRVAVDKGVTGLGVTVKEIRGRFFVYRLQTLPDGSPGAAEEAGIKAGDELLGVEELDFETERWDIDQLVSYMGELVGVVILHMMRGFGPLPRARKGDEADRMSHGVAQTDKGSTTENEDGREGDRRRHQGTGKRDGRARRLLEVMEEEELLQPSEGTDISCLYCQMSDRARQWDSGELWLSVADMARRPSKEEVAVLAEQWQPGEPAGWDDSDSSDGEPSPRSNGQARDSRSGGGNDRNSDSASLVAKTNHDGVDNDDDADPVADLDRIGTALLGQPLFSDPLSVGGRAPTSAAAAAAERRPTVRAGDQPEGNGHCWSPWPQLVALESKAAKRNTVVPTQGLRKALNVRVLGQISHQTHASTRKNDSRTAAALQSTPYLLWVMDVESGAEWRVRRCHAEFAELREVCTGMRPSLARLDFPSWLPDVKQTLGMVEARRPRLEAFLQRLCSLLYMGPLHPSSAHVAHLLQDFLGTSPRVETLRRLQSSRPERELRQALQVRAWQVFRLPPLERAVADFVEDVVEGTTLQGKKTMSADAILKKLTQVMERLQYVVTEGCFDELREMVRASAASTEGAIAGAEGTSAVAVASGRRRSASDPLKPDDEKGEGGQVEGDGEGDPAELDNLAAEEEAIELISGSVRRQVEAEMFVPVMGRLYKLLRTEGATARLEKAVALGAEAARGQPQSFHGIPLRSISPSSWSSASKLLRAMGSFTLPCDKLDALVAVAHAIPALYRVEHPVENAESLGADDFLPIFIYVLVNSKVEGVAAQSLILETLCDPKKMIGEAGFCVATLSAALQHLARSPEDQQRKGSTSSFWGRRT